MIIFEKKIDSVLNYFRLFFIIFLLQITRSGFGFQKSVFDQYYLIHDFKYSWVQYDRSENAYLPLVEVQKNTPSVFALPIDLAAYPGTHLLVKSNQTQVFFFIDNHLLSELQNKQWHTFELKTLRQHAKKDSVYLTFYGLHDPKSLQVMLGYPHQQLTEAQANQLNQIQKGNTILPKNDNGFKSSMVIVFLLNLTMITIIANNFPRSFSKYFDISAFFKLSKKEEALNNLKGMDRPNVMMVILVSLLAGYIILVVQSLDSNILSSKSFLQPGVTFANNLINFFKVSLVVFLAYVVKYFTINIVGKLFNINKILELHFYKIIQYSALFFALFLLTLLISQNLYLDLGDHIKTYFKIIVMIFFVIRTILLYFNIIQIGNIGILYLISYLCIVEILPIIMGLRILID